MTRDTTGDTPNDEAREPERSGARDMLLKPVYVTLGLGDAIAEKAQNVADTAAEDARSRRRAFGEQVRSTVESVASSVLPEPGGEGLIGGLGKLVRRAAGRNAESSLDAKAAGEDSGIPFGRGGARIRHARRTAARRRLEADLERESDTYVDRPKRTASTRTASPAPTGHRQTMTIEPDLEAQRLTSADLANPSDFVALYRQEAARRAAAREEAQMLLAMEGQVSDLAPGQRDTPPEEVIDL